MGAFIVVVLADIVVTAIRGALFSPWYYLPFVAHYGFVSGLGIYLDSSKAYRVISWWFLFVTLFWAFVVRKLLSELV